MESQQFPCLMAQNYNTFFGLYCRGHVTLLLIVPAKCTDPDGNTNLFDQMCDNVTLKGGSSMLNRHTSSQTLHCY